MRSSTPSPSSRLLRSTRISSRPVRTATFWFTESGGKVGRVTPSGTMTEFATSSSNSVPLVITTGPDGNLWFTEDGAGKVGRVTPSGTITEFASPTSNSLPTFITAGPDGNLWFTEQNAGKIGRVTPSGTITEFATSTSGSGPYDITTGPAATSGSRNNTPAARSEG